MIFIIRVRVDSSVDEQKADITVNDGVTGNAENQFEYVGIWHHDNYQVEKNYEADEHWTNSEGASVNFRFTGTKNENASDTVLSLDKAVVTP